MPQPKRPSAAKKPVAVVKKSVKKPAAAVKKPKASTANQRRQAAMMSVSYDEDEDS